MIKLGMPEILSPSNPEDVLKNWWDRSWGWRQFIVQTYDVHRRQQQDSEASSKSTRWRAVWACFLGLCCVMFERKAK